MDASETFRAVLIFESSAGVRTRTHEGPYAKEGAAKARVTFWRNHTRRHGYGRVLVDSWIEKAETRWKLVPEPLPQVPE